MKIGILSDSHGQMDRFRRALTLLTEAGAEAFIHCGDLGGPGALDEMIGQRCWFVWGNTDIPLPGWRAYVEALDLPWPDGPLDLTLDGKRLAVFHGHEPGMPEAIRDGDFDYVLHGHTHQRSDRHVGSTRVINPGALDRASVKTVAVLDLKTDTLDYLQV